MAAGELGCADAVLSIAAMLSVQNVFHLPKGARSAADTARRQFAVREGDHLTALNIYNSFLSNQKNPAWCYDNYLNHRALNRAVEIRKQLVRYCRQFGVPITAKVRCS